MRLYTKLSGMPGKKFRLQAGIRKKLLKHYYIILVLIAFNSSVRLKVANIWGLLNG